MLSDEEKEAIEKLSGKKNETTWDDTIRQIKREEIKDVVVTRQKYITAVLKLIEKQSKEIEELKEKEKQAYIDGTNIADQLCNKKWKDKIKARIKELEEYLYKGNIKDDFLMIRIKAKIQELQSLLEKE